MTQPIIEADGLVKRFGKVTALAGLDLVAYGRQATAVLGPNGAGKTTFVQAVATLLRPDTGRRQPGVGHSTGYWVTGSLLWAAGLLVLFVPLTVARWRAS